MKERLKSKTVFRIILLCQRKSSSLLEQKCHYVTDDINLPNFVTRENYLQGKKKEVVEIEKRNQVLF
jgi:hypothetical protein